jgi:hypothetical protein
MRFNILSDIDWESRVDKTLDVLTKLGYRDYFDQKNYGEGLAGVVVGFICQDPELNLKRRIRLAKKEKMIFMDIMLDLPTMKAANPELRQRIVAERLIKEVPEVVLKYKINDFDSKQFIADLQQWISETGWLALE